MKRSILLVLMIIMAFAACATQQSQMPEYGICLAGWARECLCVKRGRVKLVSEDKDVCAEVNAWARK